MNQNINSTNKKDFSQILNNPLLSNEYEEEKKSYDPNLFVNEASKIEIKRRHNQMQLMNLFSSGILSLFTAPFVTTQISLQLSVLSHKNKYGDAREQELRALLKLQTEITVQDRRKYELLIKSGVTGTNKPFRAPVYGSYLEALRGLSNQGLLGFYKGNFVGLLSTWFNSYLRFNAFDLLDYDSFKFYHQWHPFLKSVVVTTVCSLVDILCHPFQTIQSRFVLQNRLPNFFVYKSVYHLLKKHKRGFNEIMQGWRAHVPRNIIMTFCWTNFLKDRPLEGFLLSTFLSHTLSYPLLTITRRLQCQSDIPGMIPPRYSGVWHCFKLMMNEEGLRGLYRGFLAYMFVHGFTTYILISNTARYDKSLDFKLL